VEGSLTIAGNNNIEELLEAIVSLWLKEEIL
jgi:hypothetical protein